MAAKKAAKAKDTPRRRTATAKTTPAPPPAPQRDFLVIYEEDADDGLPGDDHLVLDIEAPKQSSRGELDVQQRLDLELTNTTNTMGTIGFGTTCIGALVGLGVVLYFMVSFPGNWYTPQGGMDPTGAVKPTILLAVLAMVLLAVGTILTHYGRRIQARGNLTQVRIVEKSSQSKARLQ